MKLLVTPQSHDYTLLVVDTEKKKVIKEVPRDRAGDNKNADDTRYVHRVFGMTWNKDKVFVANRRNLLVYGEDWKLENIIEDVLDENTHQITWWNDRIISCMTRKDCIQIMKEDGTESEFFHPYKGWGTFPTLGHAEKRKDWYARTLDPTNPLPGDTFFDASDGGKMEVLHINAVNVIDDVLYMLLCGTKKKFKSEVVMLDLKTRKVKNRVFLDRSKAHGMYVDEIGMGLMFSLESVIYWKDLVFENPKGLLNHVFLRGMAGDKDEIVLGWILS